MKAGQIYDEARSRVLQIMVERNRDLIGAGTAFLVEGGFVTNSHCLPEDPDAFVALRFADQPPTEPAIRLRCGDLQIPVRSPDYEHDFAFIQCDEAELRNRHQFSFGDLSSVAVCDEEYGVRSCLLMFVRSQHVTQSG